MNSSSKVVMAAIIVMVASLVMVLSLVLVLLAELYCSFLLRRRRLRHSFSLPTTTVATAAKTTTSLGQAISTTDEPSPSNIDFSSNPLTAGVLQTPKSFIKVPIDNGSVDNFIYISNTIYSNEVASKPTTPFETPHSSPSRLETGDSSSSSSGEEDNDIVEDSTWVGTPELTPMKDLPEKACSVSLKDARSLKTSDSESNSNNNNGGSSSSSGSPYTSPSW